MARKMACCAQCRVNLSRAGGWTNVAPRRSLISVHWNRDELLGVHDFIVVVQCLLPVEQSVLIVGLHGVVVVWIVAGEYHLHSCLCTEDAVSEGSDGFSSLAIGGDLGVHRLVRPDAAYCALGVHAGSSCSAVRPLLKAWFTSRELLAAHRT